MAFSKLVVTLSINPTDHHIGESELVKRLRAKDKSALDYLYDHYSGALYSVILRIVKAEELAEEVLQDAFLKFWTRIDTYDSSKGKLFTWMLNIARNGAIDKTRSKELAKGRKTDGLENFVNRKQGDSFEEEFVDTIGIKELLKNLTEDQKFVVEYLYFKGYSQSELAKEFNIPLGTVKTRLRLAMQHLRLILSSS